ncbi:hypothetical protein A3C89_01845 [Candidatus Kaiserbacteria bacterium RIFCSPHIGHO2_02_FULL_50_50]|uniref:Lipid II flippase MurJ n=1 Tax=Candidatus Kaiserbacteria bacterium RIFCSPHIGHO2_02_FULL_50_50 TaxID=1798492 RepID=A0A1F6DCH3_9BACT|nr:MAG: hypothetical protein A3C89_01845 [Candidatus Kaiserbacteria bacterium RIFCSPHIGHO2_02_FULL_50_50]OGG89014.1 MAG: hypothetical protein A3G62_04250 [Candidatus Kaiserbacteria bacterium RIFCSPLOWO2_12_FULL_50_10]
MINKLFAFTQKEIRGMHQAAYVLAALTFGSQLLALLRDRLLTHTFGLSGELDLYFAAFRVPDLLFVIFSAALSAYVLIPFVSERMAGSAERAQHLLSQVFTLFSGVYAFAALLVALTLPYYAHVLFPGFTGAQHAELILLVRILLLQPFFLGVSGIFAVVTQLHHRFILFAISPLLYNIGIILGIVALYPFLGSAGLVWGVVLGAFLHAAVQIPSILASRLAPRMTHVFEWRALAIVIRDSLPRAFTLSMQQITLFVFVSLATIIGTGTVAALQLSYNLQSVPLAIIGMSYSVAAFPLLARAHAEGDFERFRHEVSAGIRHVLFWTLPIIALAIVLRAQFVRVILGSGEFSWNDTRLTAAVFALFVVSLAAQSLHLLCVRAWYAAGNTRVPFFTTLATTALIIGLAYFFTAQYALVANMLETTLRVEDVLHTKLLALPLAYSLGTILGVAFLVHATVRTFRIDHMPLHASLLRSIVAALSGGSVAYAMLNAVVYVFGTRITLWGVLGQGFIAGALGMVTVFVVYALTKSPEFNDLHRALSKKLFKAQPVLGEDTPRD